MSVELYHVSYYSVVLLGSLVYETYESLIYSQHDLREIDLYSTLFKSP